MSLIKNTPKVKAVKVLPWGEEIYLEFSINKKSSNIFYALHGRTSDGREYIEFNKFGPKPNTENETYRQKLRIFDPIQWAAMKHYVEGELASSLGWDLPAAQKEFEESLTKKEEPVEV